MIFIDFNDDIFPQEIRDEAQRLTNELARIADPAARSRYIEGHADFWRRQVRPLLMRMSHGKCWYSEARDVVSVWHVDHYRPKGDVRDEDGATRPGYWWLAFKLSNYRLSGPVMNTVRRDQVDGPLLGKWDRFPLAEGSFVAVDRDCDEGLEAPILLDPCRKDDWTLITFDEDGKPVPNCDEEEFGHVRATISIRLLHLDFDPLNEERRRVWNRCEEKVRAASAIMRLPQREIAYRRAEYDRIIEDIREMMADDAELSAVARACLQHSPLRWARKLATMSVTKKVA